MSAAYRRFVAFLDSPVDWSPGGGAIWLLVLSGCIAVGLVYVALRDEHRRRA